MATDTDISITIQEDEVNLAIQIDQPSIEFEMNGASVPGPQGIPGPAGESGIIVSATPPPSPESYDLWLDIG